MSLNLEQQNNTRKELQENFKKSGLTVKQIAIEFETTEVYLEQVFNLEAKKHEHTWILRNYLYEKVKESGKNPTEYTALNGSCRNYWFLNADYIEKGKIDLK